MKVYSHFGATELDHQIQLASVEHVQIPFVIALEPGIRAVESKP